MSCAKEIGTFHSSVEAVYGSLLKQRLDNQRLQTAQAATNLNSKQCPCPASCSLTLVRAQEENHGLGHICLRPSFLGILLQMLSITSESVTLAYKTACAIQHDALLFVSRLMNFYHCTPVCFLQNKRFLPWEETQLPRAVADQKPAHSKWLSAHTITFQGCRTSGTTVWQHLPTALKALLIQQFQIPLTKVSTLTLLACCLPPSRLCAQW